MSCLFILALLPECFAGELRMRIQISYHLQGVFVMPKFNLTVSSPISHLDIPPIRRHKFDQNWAWNFLGNELAERVWLQFRQEFDHTLKTKGGTARLLSPRARQEMFLKFFRNAFVQDTTLCPPQCRARGRASQQLGNMLTPAILPPQCVLVLPAPCATSGICASVSFFF